MAKANIYKIPWRIEIARTKTYLDFKIFYIFKPLMHMKKCVCVCVAFSRTRHTWMWCMCHWMFSLMNTLFLILSISGTQLSCQLDDNQAQNFRCTWIYVQFNSSAFIPLSCHIFFLFSSHFSLHLTPTCRLPSFVSHLLFPLLLNIQFRCK